MQALPAFADFGRNGTAQSSCNAAAADLRDRGQALRPLPETPAFVSGLDDLAVAGEAVGDRQIAIP